MFKTLFASVQKQFADYRRYRRAIAEIEAMTTRDLIDMRADETEMRNHIWQSIYGEKRA